MSLTARDLKRSSTTRVQPTAITRNTDPADRSSPSPETEPPFKRRKVQTDEIQGIAVTTSMQVNSATISLESSNVAALVEVDNLERDTMGDSWYAAISSEIRKPYFLKLKDFLRSEVKTCTVYPALKNIYSWSRLTPLDAVKVVVIGQDPYHDVNQAHGLAFSVLPPTKHPPSLKNIYKELKSEFPDTFQIPTTGDLSPLAKLGVLFLNTCLTVRAHKANSHAKKGWEQFTTAALRAVAQRKSPTGVVFFAWGLPAQKTCKAVGIDETKHLVLRSAHPSPLSAYRGFFGNGHFKQANNWLEERYGPGGGIDWAALHD